jgi:predicted negative regulator of RcsB-dependent stress response
MIYFIIGIVGTFGWIAYEMHTAPMYDEKTKKFIKKKKNESRI